MLATPEDVISALKRYRDVFDPRTGSIIATNGRAFDPSTEPFRVGFLYGLPERAELIRRMQSRLRARERHLLVLWYIVDLPVKEIAIRIKISRMHCYRLRKEAVNALADEPDETYPPDQREVFSGCAWRPGWETQTRRPSLRRNGEKGGRR